MHPVAMGCAGGHQLPAVPSRPAVRPIGWRKKPFGVVPAHRWSPEQDLSGYHRKPISLQKSPETSPGVRGVHPDDNAHCAIWYPEGWEGHLMGRSTKVKGLKESPESYGAPAPLACPWDYQQESRKKLRATPLRDLSVAIQSIGLHLDTH